MLVLGSPGGSTIIGYVAQALIAHLGISLGAYLRGGADPRRGGIALGE